MRRACAPRTRAWLSGEARPVLGKPVRATVALALTATRIFVSRLRGLKRPEIGQFRQYGLMRAESLSVRRLGTLARPSGLTPRAALIANAHA